MLRYFICCAIISTLVWQNADAARILVLFPFPGKSHHISFQPLVEELAKRGHEVTVVSAFPRKTPLKNYEDIVIRDLLHKEESHNMFESHNMNTHLFMVFMRSVTLELCEEFLKEDGVQNLIHSPDVHFDLIIYEPFFSECVHGLIYKLKAPFIYVSASTHNIWMGEGVGNSNLFSIVPDIMLGYSSPMSFKERLINTLTGTFFYLERTFITLPKMEAVMRKYLPDPNMPSIREIEANASFLLLNTHPAFFSPRPLTPNTAEVGGMHLKEAGKLPEDLQKLLDEAEDGVIYFSLGSNIKSTDMPEEMRQKFLNVFSRLKQKVLWKWESETLPGQPKNVYLSKWFPQTDVLGHRNIKAFITHGGLLGTQEAIYFGVPVLTIPFWGDQKHNALKASEQGYAVLLDVKNITEEALEFALNQILTEPQYREKAKSLSKLFRDQPESPVERAVFWTEYVIRHRGAPHLRSAALELNFFQYFLLDVIAVIALVAGALLAVSTITCRVIFRRICSSSKHSQKEKKRKMN